MGSESEPDGPQEGDASAGTMRWAWAFAAALDLMSDIAAQDPGIIAAGEHKAWPPGSTGSTVAEQA